MGAHVCFDIGNVLCHVYLDRFTNKLSEVINLSTNECYHYLERLQPLQDVGISSIYRSLKHDFELPEEKLQELVAVWNSIVIPNEMMLNFLDKLRGDGVKIALLSNMGPEHMIYLRQNFPKIFEKTIQHISCEVGARKPSKMFFQSFCLDNDEFRSGRTEDGYLDFNGCVYVDDIEENLKSGKRYGFKVYQFHLEEFCQLSQSKQKIELDRLRSMIINKM